MEQVKAKKIQLSRSKGAYVVDVNKGTEIRTIIMDAEWVERQNEIASQTGILYVIDKEASKKLNDSIEKAIDARKNGKDIAENKKALALGKAIAESIKPKEVKEPKKDAEKPKEAPMELLKEETK